MTHRRNIKGYVGAGDFSRETRPDYSQKESEAVCPPSDNPIIRFFKKWYKPNWEEKYEEYLTTREGVYTGRNEDE